MMYSGKVILFNQRGFGFIYCDELKRRLFFHISQFSGAQEPSVNQRVQFDVTKGKTGQLDLAVNVAVVETVNAGADALKAGV